MFSYVQLNESYITISKCLPELHMQLGTDVFVWKSVHLRRSPYSCVIPLERSLVSALLCFLFTPASNVLRICVFHVQLLM